MSEEQAPETDRSPITPKKLDPKIEIPVIGPGAREPVSFAEFWSDPCWSNDEFNQDLERKRMGLKPKRR